MKKLGVDIITNDASYRRWLKKHRIDYHFIARVPPEYPCIVETETKVDGDEFVEFTTMSDLLKQIMRLEKLNGILVEIYNKRCSSQSNVH